MRTISVALAAHLAQTVTTLATCWKVTRRRPDGTDLDVFGFTDHARDLVVDGLTYQAATGYTASAVKTVTGLAVDNLEVRGLLDAATITEADLIAGKWDHAAIEVFQVNYNDLTMGKLILRAGNLGEVRFGPVGFVAELRGLTAAFAQNIGRIYQPSCDADLGDTRCGVNLATFTDGTISTTVTGVTSTRVFAASALGQPADWFSGGLVTWTAGENDGLAMECKSFAGGSVELAQAMPFAITVGDAFTITAGCDKLHTTCFTKFNNIVRFRGFPHVPGTDRGISGQ